MSDPTVRVVVIDADKAIRRFVRSSLEAAGMSVFEAQTGAQGLAQAATRLADLVIIDLNLPKAPGLAVLRVMRRSVKCKDAAVVILSSSDLQKEKDDAAALGANRFLRKPMRLEEFLSLGAVFKALLERRPAI